MRKKYNLGIDVANAKITHITAIDTGESMEFPFKLNDTLEVHLDVIDWSGKPDSLIPRVKKFAMRVRCRANGDLIGENIYRHYTHVSAGEILARILGGANNITWPHGGVARRTLEDKIRSMREAKPCYSYDSTREIKRRLTASFEGIKNLIDCIAYLEQHDKTRFDKAMADIETNDDVSAVIDLIQTLTHNKKEKA